MKQTLISQDLPFQKSRCRLSDCRCDGSKKAIINQFKPVWHSRHQVLRGYCHNINTLTVAYLNRKHEDTFRQAARHHLVSNCKQEILWSHAIILNHCVSKSKSYSLLVFSFGNPGSWWEHIFKVNFLHQG